MINKANIYFIVFVIFIIYGYSVLFWGACHRDRLLISCATFLRSKAVCISCLELNHTDWLLQFGKNYARFLMAYVTINMKTFEAGLVSQYMHRVAFFLISVLKAKLVARLFWILFVCWYAVHKSVLLYFYFKSCLQGRSLSQMLTVLPSSTEFVFCLLT
jgi:hypothetical protein